MNDGLSKASVCDFSWAIQRYARAVTESPDDACAHFNLGLAFKQSGDALSAVQHYKKAAELNPADADTFFNWGNALLAVGEPRAAINQYQRALALKPKNPNFLTNLAIAHQEAGDLTSALTYFHELLALSPQSADSKWNLSLALLKAGRYKAAWPLFEARLIRRQWRSNYPHRYTLPRWQGESFIGRHLLVHFEQGFGDTIQFMRYLPMVKALGGRVTLEVPATLLPLAENLEGVDEAVSFNEKRPADVGADLYVPLLSLGGIFETRLQTIPSRKPYILAPKDRLSRWKSSTSSQAMNVGLVWSGKNTDPARACRLRNLEPLFELGEINWIGLQKGAAARELDEIALEPKISNLGSQLADFGDTAALIHHLDLVVTVDTAMAHLASAMGKPVFCLLRFAADWRWMESGDRTPWYPSMRLFRQERAGQWSEPIMAMATALSEIRDQIQLPPSQNILAGGADRNSNVEKTTATQFLFKEALRQSTAGEFDTAIDMYREFLTSIPEHPIALFNLGLCHRKKGDTGAAQKAYQAAIAIVPDFVDAHYNLANLYKSQKAFSEAIAAYKRVLELKPDHLDALLNMSAALAEAGQDADAETSLKVALTRWPESPAIQHQLGQTLSRRGCWTEAIRHFAKAVFYSPARIVYRYNLGHALFQFGRYREAAEVFQKIVAEYPEHVPARVNLGNALKERGCLEEAEGCFVEALRLEPDRAETRWNLALVRLLMGNYTAAWPDFEARWLKANWRMSYPFRLDLPRWQGQSLKGKTLFIHDEQGLGDALQFLRYLPLLKQLGGRIVFETREPLINLCTANKVADEIRLRGAFPQVPQECDYSIPLMSLPGVFGHTIEKIPNRVPYMLPSKEDVRRWRGRLPEGQRKVGLVWAGRPVNRDEAPGLRGRSCGFSAIKPLIDAHPHTAFVGLQQGPAAEEAVFIDREFINLGPDLTDFAVTAGLIAHLDLIITIDTSVAHLAGAMGKPVWILLQPVGDWRWLLGRSDSPYYPTARLFRQRESGDWPSVIAQIMPLLDREKI